MINPPVLKLTSRGNALAKSLAGDTVFAAIFTASVATTAVNIEMATITGEVKRLGGDPAFSRIGLSQVLDPAKFVGRAPQQVQRFVASVVAPIRTRFAGELRKPAELKV